jgi:hypothetical protein
MGLSTKAKGGFPFNTVYLPLSYSGNPVVIQGSTCLTGRGAPPAEKQQPRINMYNVAGRPYIYMGRPVYTCTRIMTVWRSSQGGVPVV